MNSQNIIFNEIENIFLKSSLQQKTIQRLNTKNKKLQKEKDFLNESLISVRSEFDEITFKLNDVEEQSRAILNQNEEYFKTIQSLKIFKNEISSFVNGSKKEEQISSIDLTKKSEEEEISSIDLTKESEKEEPEIETETYNAVSTHVIIPESTITDNVTMDQIKYRGYLISDILNVLIKGDYFKTLGVDYNKTKMNIYTWGCQKNILETYELMGIRKTYLVNNYVTFKSIKSKFRRCLDNRTLLKPEVDISNLNMTILSDFLVHIFDKIYMSISNGNDMKQRYIKQRYIKHERNITYKTIHVDDNDPICLESIPSYAFIIFENGDFLKQLRLLAPKLINSKYIWRKSFAIDNALELMGLGRRYYHFSKHISYKAISERLRKKISQQYGNNNKLQFIRVFHALYTRIFAGEDIIKQCNEWNKCQKRKQTEACVENSKNIIEPNTKRSKNNESHIITRSVYRKQLKDGGLSSISMMSHLKNKSSDNNNISNEEIDDEETEETETEETENEKSENEKSENEKSENEKSENEKSEGEETTTEANKEICVYRKSNDPFVFSDISALSKVLSVEFNRSIKVNVPIKLSELKKKLELGLANKKYDVNLIANRIKKNYDVVLKWKGRYK